jgi:predicted metal-dependent peptidase
MLLAIDTSGSVSDSELKEFMSEIYHIINVVLILL